MPFTVERTTISASPSSARRCCSPCKRVLKTHRLERENVALREVLHEGDSYGELIGTIGADAAALPNHRKGRRHRRDGFGGGRVRHRQGAGGADPPPGEPTGKRPIRRGQLRRHPRDPDRERALRPREGVFHRRPPPTRRAVSRRPTAGPFCSTRLPRCRCPSRPRSCASSRSAA